LISTSDSFRPTASLTRKPWRNISRIKQRYRASCRGPFVAANSFSTSTRVKCFRSSFILCTVSLFLCVHNSRT
jgi:hypothetical protein